MLRIILLLVLLISVALNCALIGRFVWTRPSRLRRLVQRLLLVLLPAALTLLVLEAAAYQFAVFSDGMGHTLAAQRWMQRYWQPINAQGFRDVDHSWQQLSERDVLLVTGDSFVAGHGIERVEDRFANVAAESLGPSWQLVVLAQNGWHTGQEFEAVRQFPGRPRVIIWSYFINDIEGAARQQGQPPPDLALAPENTIMRAVVARSYLANFLYWRWRRSGQDNSLMAAYTNYLRTCYESPAVWQVHRAQLLDAVKFLRESDVDVVFVVFPHLKLTQQTQLWSDRVVEVLRTAGADVLDVSALIAEVPPEQRVVNAYDAHPSAHLHRLVGLRLADMVRRVAIDDSNVSPATSARREP